MFTFKSLLGAQSDSPAVQSLLEFDGGVKILVDVGWDESFDVDRLQQLERETPTISLILLTHPTLSHIGAYAYCCKHIPLFSRIPVYATTPVISLGRTLLQDVYASTPLASATLPSSVLEELTYSFPSFKSGDASNILLPAPSPEEIVEYFDVMHSLKFSQQHQPTPSPNSPPLEGLTITAHSAGHSLGGTMWHIQHGSESVIYAVDWNQVRENVLTGAAWLGSSSAPGSEVVPELRQPSALICSSKGCDSLGSEGGLTSRDELLIKHVRTTVEEGGTVLIPCDSSARVLEVAYLLERVWDEDDTLRKCPLYMASNTSGATMRYARSMLEWMDERVVREFESKASLRVQGDRNNASPFNFKHMKLIERKTQLSRALANDSAKVFIASDTSLTWGYSKDILESICGDEKNLLVLPDNIASISRANMPKPPRSGSSLLSAIAKKLNDETAQQLDEVVSASKVQIIALGSNELPAYQQYLARQRQRQNGIAVDKETALETSADVLDDRSSSTSSSDASDDELQGKALNTFASLTHTKQKLGATDEELGINILLRRKDIHDYDVRGKRGRERVFPYVVKRRRADDFGDVIRAEEYLRAEERIDANEQTFADEAGRGDASVGQKRRFGTQTDLHGPDSSAKRRKAGSGRAVNEDDANRSGAVEDQYAEDDSDESEYEPEEAAILGPRKVVLHKHEVHFKLRAVAVDFSGLHEQRSLHMLLPLIKPRKLILTAGTASETAKLKADCERLLVTNSEQQGAKRGSEIFAPSVGESVDASVDTDAWTIKLSPALVRTLHWQHFRDLDLVTINGKVDRGKKEDIDESNSTSKRLKTNGQEPSKRDASSATSGNISEDNLPMLQAMAAGFMATARSLTESVHVGDLRLFELRNVLRALNHSAEFRGEGVLLVDGYITVRKDGIGRIEVEGGGGTILGHHASSFNAVKQRIYEGLAVVSAR